MSALCLDRVVSSLINLSAESPMKQHPCLWLGNINRRAIHKPEPLALAIRYRAPRNKQLRMKEAEQWKNGQGDACGIEADEQATTITHRKKAASQSHRGEGKQLA